MNSNEKVMSMRDKMSAIADLALTCEAKIGFCTSPDGSVGIIEEYAENIAKAAMDLLPDKKRVGMGMKPFDPFMIGPFKIEHVSSTTVSVAKVRIGERTFSCETADAGDFCTVMIYDNGNQMVEMTVKRGKVTAFQIGVMTMRAYIHELSGNNHKGNNSKGRRGFLPREIAKMEAAK